MGEDVSNYNGEWESYAPKRRGISNEKGKSVEGEIPRARYIVQARENDELRQPVKSEKARG